MLQNRTIELWVGLFMIFGMVSLSVLAFKVSGLTGGIDGHTYTVTANFDNVGGLKVRSRVTMAGVKVGEVSDIRLDPKTLRAVVLLKIEQEADQIPNDSAASIFTEGLLGANYVSLTPGFSNAMLQNGSLIKETHSAIVLENLISQFLFNSAQKKNTGS